MRIAVTALAACTARAAEAPTRVSLGVDELLAHHVDLIAGKRVGLITNPSGVDGELVQGVASRLDPKDDLDVQGDRETP